MREDTLRPLTLEALLNDPLVRMVMDADGVTPAEFAAVLYAARDAVASRGRVSRPEPFLKPAAARRAVARVPA